MSGVRIYAVVTISAITLFAVAGCGASTSSGPVTSAPAVVDSLTGFGATAERWEAAHTADARFTPGSAYDPDPSVGFGNTRFDDRYYSVDSSGGYVTRYEMRLPSQTSISAARAAVLREFPRDAKTKWFAVKGACAQMGVSSAILGRALQDPAIGDPGGSALVEFSSGVNGDRYDPSSVTDALLFAWTPMPRPDTLDC